MASPETLQENLRVKMLEAEYKAWDSLARYKFIMFGYWAGQWVLLNRVGKFKEENPFHQLVDEARAVRVDLIDQSQE